MKGKLEKPAQETRLFTKTNRRIDEKNGYVMVKLDDGNTH